MQEISAVPIYNYSSGSNAPFAIQLVNPIAASAFPSYNPQGGTPLPLSTTAALVLNVLGSRRLEGVPMRVSASGWLTTGVLSTFTPAFYWAAVNDFKSPNSSVNAFAMANNLVMASVTTAALAVGSYNWQLEAMLVGDSKSQTMQGSFKARVNNVYTAEAAITNALTASSTPAFPAGGLTGLGKFALGLGAGDVGGLNVEGNSGIWLLVAASFGTGNAGNLVQLDSFYIEA